MFEYDVDKHGNRECQVLITILEDEMEAIEKVTGCKTIQNYDDAYNSMCELLEDISNYAQGY